MRPEYQEVIRIRTELASRLYVGSIVDEGVRNLFRAPGDLDRRAAACANAALHFSMAEAVIYQHYHKLEQEAKDGQASSE